MSDLKFSYRGYSFLCHYCDSLMFIDDVDDTDFKEVYVYFLCPHCNTSLISSFRYGRFISGHFHFEDPENHSEVKDFFIF